MGTPPRANTVFRFGLPFVLKLSNRTKSTEADALHYLNSQFSGVNRLPIPQVYDSFPLGPYTYTLMSKLPGDMIATIASPLTEAFYQRTCSEIEAVMRHIWSLPQPQHLKGQVMISASDDGLNTWDDILRPPFPSMLSYYAESTRFYDEEAMIRTMAPKFGDVEAIFEADPVVFAHPDLTLPNVLVTKDGRLTGIIDWEDAGWCPMQYQWRCLRLNSGFSTEPYIAQWEKMDVPECTQRAYDLASACYAHNPPVL